MPGVAPREPSLEVSVDWYGDGNYTLAASNLTSRLLVATLAVQRGRDSAQPLGQPMVPTCAWEVHNQDRLLSPQFAGSNIYGLVKPGKPLRVRATAGGSVLYDDTVAYDAPVFYDGIAIVSLISGQLARAGVGGSVGQRVATIPGVGALAKLRGVKISTALYGLGIAPYASGIRTDQALTILLDAAGWPSDRRIIAVGDATLDFWWLNDEDAFNAACDLLATEGAPSYLGESADGYLVFENRNYRSNAWRSQNIQATFYDRITGATAYNDHIDYNAPVLYDGLPTLYFNAAEYDPGLDSIYNQITVTTTRRAVAALVGKVWEYGGPLVLGASESRLVEARLPDPVTAVVALDATDYVVVPGGALASPPTLEYANAQTVGIRFIATSAGATINGVTSNGPQLRAKAATVTSSSIERQTTDTSVSVTSYGTLTLQLAARAEINRSTAVALCDAAADYYQEPRPIVRLSVTNIDATHLRHQLSRDVSDLIAIISEYLGFGSGGQPTGWIEQVEQRRILEGLQTVFTVEMVIPQAGAALWGADDADPIAGLWGSNDADPLAGVWGR